MEPWYKVAMPRKEVREGRSFDPSEFAIALEQVVAGTAPVDYRDPVKFFHRTFFTRALKEHVVMVMRRLAGETVGTAPVLTLITQFGGGKTHTLAALYHMITMSAEAERKLTTEGTEPLLELYANCRSTEWRGKAKVAAFVGNAWDPQDGRENPWIDIARQLAGDVGVACLGKAAKTTPPGTVLILFDEVLNFINRHREMADSFFAFIQNLTVAMTGTTHGSAVISLPRSQVEMTDSDILWQERITKVVKRVAKDLIANDEREISEVVRRRLFEEIDYKRNRKIIEKVTKAYADWCFEHRAQLPSEWTAIDTTSTESKAREFLRSRFEACYPFHPATLSVFQRKWQALHQYQQTRGTLAMLAQWISWAYRDAYQRARREPLITLGSAPLEVEEFRSVIIGQLGEQKLKVPIDTDIAGAISHARALDADTKGPLRDIHRRVGATILFESSGGQVDKVAHLPELRFALGEPEIDTTSIDNAAFALETKAFFVRKVGTDGFKIHHQPTLKKVVSDRRASLDEEEVIKEVLELVKKEFQQGAKMPLVFFPEDSSAVQDSPKLTIVVVEPELEWAEEGELRNRTALWSKQRDSSPRLYPGSLIWCMKKSGRDLQEKIELWLAWRRVYREITEGSLGEEFDRSERSGVVAKVKDAEEVAKDEVWAGYRFVQLVDNSGPDGLRKNAIDLGAGHASSGETLSARVIHALKSEGLLNESVGASYIERHWPPALKEAGAWPLSGLRQSFLNGALTRLLDPDTVLRAKIVEFVARGDFGLASGRKTDGSYDRVWFNEPLPSDEIAFEADIFLLSKGRAKELKIRLEAEEEKADATLIEKKSREVEKGTDIGTARTEVVSPTELKTLLIIGSIPPEIKNRFGTKLLPKIRMGNKLCLGLELSVGVDAGLASSLESELRQILRDLGISDSIRIEVI